MHNTSSHHPLISCLMIDVCLGIGVHAVVGAVVANSSDRAGTLVTIWTIMTSPAHGHDKAADVKQVVTWQGVDVGKQIVKVHSENCT